MRTPESKQLNRREMLQAVLAAGLAGCQWTTTKKVTRTKVAEVIAKPEAVEQSWPEFAHLDMLVDQYKSNLPEIREYIKEELRYLIDPDELLAKCFAPLPNVYNDPIRIDFDGIPNTKLRSMKEFLPVIGRNPNLKLITAHQAPPENDTGVVCIWYGQNHGLVNPVAEEFTRHGPAAIDSQLRILTSAQELAEMGVRLFCTEHKTSSVPATPDNPGQTKNYDRLSEELERETEAAAKGASAFQILKERYPFIDLNGVDEHRRQLILAQTVAIIIVNNPNTNLSGLVSAEQLLDETKAEAYVKYLKTHGKSGEDILRDIRLANSAHLCVTSSRLDHDGPDIVGSAIHTQLKHMKQVLKDTSFLKAQTGQEFVPNVFALQYGLGHYGIPKACQKLGVSCIAVNATNTEYSDVLAHQKQNESAMKDSRKVLENLRR